MPKSAFNRLFAPEFPMHPWVITGIAVAVVAGVGAGKALQRELGEDQGSKGKKESGKSKSSPAKKTAAQKVTNFAQRSANKAAKAVVRSWWERKRKGSEKKNDTEDEG